MKKIGEKKPLKKQFNQKKLNLIEKENKTQFFFQKKFKKKRTTLKKSSQKKKKQDSKKKNI